MTAIIRPRSDIQGEYGELTRQDVLSPVQGLFGKAFLMGADGIAHPIAKDSLEIGTPWIHSVPGSDKDCGMWHHIMFDEYHILPSSCMECWKVVVSPRNLEELFGLLAFQRGETGATGPAGLDRGCGHPCKCGIEVRVYTPKLYGGYFYNNSLEEGMACYEWVRAEMTALFDSELKVILKRACTEFEIAFGDSRQWVTPPGQLDREADILQLFGRERFENPPRQPEVMNPAIKKRWIHWAFQSGDQTYKKYTDGEALYDPAVTYHDMDLSKLETKTVERIEFGPTEQPLDTTEARI